MSAVNDPFLNQIQHSDVADRTLVRYCRVWGLTGPVHQPRLFDVFHQEPSVAATSAQNIRFHWMLSCVGHHQSAGYAHFPPHLA